jgi:hypothetical protein
MHYPAYRCIPIGGSPVMTCSTRAEGDPSSVSPSRDRTAENTAHAALATGVSHRVVRRPAARPHRAPARPGGAGPPRTPGAPPAASQRDLTCLRDRDGSRNPVRTRDGRATMSDPEHGPGVRNSNRRHRPRWKRTIPVCGGRAGAARHSAAGGGRRRSGWLHRCRRVQGGARIRSARARARRRPRPLRRLGDRRRGGQRAGQRGRVKAPRRTRRLLRSPSPVRRRLRSLRKQCVAVDDGSGDVDELAVGGARVVA